MQNDLIGPTHVLSTRKVSSPPLSWGHFITIEHGCHEVTALADPYNKSAST